MYHLMVMVQNNVQKAVLFFFQNKWQWPLSRIRERLVLTEKTSAVPVICYIMSHEIKFFNYCNSLLTNEAYLLNEFAGEIKEEKKAHCLQLSKGCVWSWGRTSDSWFRRNAGGQEKKCSMSLGYESVVPHLTVPNAYQKHHGSHRHFDL